MQQKKQFPEFMRINQYLSQAGVCSRREADRYILAGRIAVDGKPATIGMQVQIGQKVTFDKKEVSLEKEEILLLFHKPKGIVCTTAKTDPNNIIDFLQFEKRIYPVGRLDKDSEGLLLLTNEGRLVNRILKSVENHEKEYLVTIDRPLTEKFIQKMKRGVPILDTVTKPCEVIPVTQKSFRIILTQGLNRQIRRMCEALGYHVMALKRIRIMNLYLGRLQVGAYRKVSQKERETLLNWIEKGDRQR